MGLCNPVDVLDESEAGEWECRKSVYESVYVTVILEWESLHVQI